MHWNTNATRIRRELMVSILELFDRGVLEQEIERIPYRMVPKGSQSVRCCVHHDRAIIRDRILGRLGLRVDASDDEGQTLSEFASEALSREKIEGPILTIIDEACHACVQSRYFVTNACQGCMARPCQSNCPKKSISMVDGHAQIDPATCVSCGICTKACPYGAILKIPVPCEEACPVNAISKDERGREKIDWEACISCGSCITHCPFGAITDRSQILDVARGLSPDSARRPIVALVAPALLAQFRAEVPVIVAAIEKLGFDAVYEVALGADKVAEAEASELLEYMKENRGTLASSCCPAWVEAVQKHLPASGLHLSHNPSPMRRVAAMARAEFVAQGRGEPRVVFIGPCVAKKFEALKHGDVDFVLTAEELGAFFIARKIELAATKASEGAPVPSADGRGFAEIGGVSNAVLHAFDVEEMGRCPKIERVNGLTKETMKILRSSKPDCDFVEGMACEGGCICGPSILVNPRIAQNQLKQMKKVAAV